MCAIPIFQNVPLQKIEHSQTLCLHPFFSLTNRQDNSLAKSIKNVGILQPPLMKHNTREDTYQILAGRYRLQIFRELQPDRKNIPCLVVNDTITPLAVLYHILEDQRISGALSPMEKAYFFSHSLEHMSIDMAADNFLPIMGEKVQTNTIKKYISLLQLEPELQISVHCHKTTEKTALELLQLSSMERKSIHSIFKKLRLGGGKQKRLLSLCRDLAYRGNKTIAELLSEKKIRMILNHGETNTPQKAAILLGFLQKQLFPQSEEAEKLFKKKVAQMALPSCCNIEHSPAFETDHVSLKVQFSSWSELEKNKETIKRLLSVDALVKT